MSRHSLPVPAIRLRIRNIMLILAVFIVQGCALQRSSIHIAASKDLPDFVTIIAGSNDTLPSLAARYLHNPEKSWIISEFNNISSVSAGQELVIPLEPFDKAGLSRQGYQTVPVLAYHNFSNSKKTLMVTRKDHFEQQMKYLKDNGYTVISLNDFFDFLDYRKQIPEKSVVITIDDGWRSVYDIAYPILKKYHYPATLFVYTDLITGSRKTLSWQQIAEMAQGGLDIQCHTKTHRDLNKAEDHETLQKYARDINKEITASARIIKEKINKKVKYFAYPYGDTNRLVIAFLKKNGYRGAFTVKRRSNPFFVNHYRVNRAMVYGDFNLQAFKRNLKVYSNKALR